MSLKSGMNEFPLLEEKDGISLFYPYVPKGSIDSVIETLSTRWIGQGPKVEQFEGLIRERFAPEHAVLAVGSGTDALHLAYILAGIEPGDEVIVPVFTCTATNIPLLYIGAKIVFADINSETMNIDIDSLESLITPKTRAIVCVDYGGYPCDYQRLVSICNKYNLKLISDAAHSIGSKYRNTYACQFADFTIFSFQAIKTITTGDGGALLIKNKKLEEKAKRLRWFGIDRAAKQKGIWENDIKEIGFKYQMTDIAASLGIASMQCFDSILTHRRTLFEEYSIMLQKIEAVKLIPRINNEDIEFCPWLVTILTEDRIRLMTYLRDQGIESAQVHYRNDRYSIFEEFKRVMPIMDECEDKYLVLPLHMRMNKLHVKKICDAIKNYYETT